MKKTWGVEIEGGFKRWSNVFTQEEIETEKVQVACSFWHMGHDGSVSIRSRDSVVTEVRSSPSNIESIMKNFGMLYKIMVETNTSCGTHIHVGVNKKYYPIFCQTEYVDFFMEEYKKNYRENQKYLDRISNRYCPHKNAVSDILAQFWCKTSKEYDSGARYSAVNFPYYKHGTIEYRIFPYIDITNGKLSAARELANMINFVDTTMDKYSENKSPAMELSVDIQIKTRQKEEIINV